MDLVDMHVLLLLLIGAAKHQVHDQHLPGYHNADEQDGKVLGLVLEVIDEGDQQDPTIDDLHKKYHHEDDQLDQMSPVVTDERVVEVGQQQRQHVKNAGIVLHIDEWGFGGNFMLAAEDAKSEDGLCDDQCPRNDELDLRVEEDDPIAVLLTESEQDCDDG